MLNNLRKDKNVIITRPDKSNGLVILNRNDYVNKTEEILNHKTKYKILQVDWLKHSLRLEGRLNSFEIDKKKLPDNYYEWLFASGSSPGVLYGLPKVHKLGCPIRPILSAINTFNYNLAKLCPYFVTFNY